MSAEELAKTTPALLAKAVDGDGVATSWSEKEGQICSSLSLQCLFEFLVELQMFAHLADGHRNSFFHSRPNIVVTRVLQRKNRHVWDRVEVLPTVTGSIVMNKSVLPFCQPG